MHVKIKKMNLEQMFISFQWKYSPSINHNTMFHNTINADEKNKLNKQQLYKSNFIGKHEKLNANSILLHLDDIIFSWLTAHAY